MIVVIAATVLSVTAFAKTVKDSGYVGGKRWDARLETDKYSSNLTVAYYGNNGNITARLYTTIYDTSNPGDRWTRYQSDTHYRTAGCFCSVGLNQRIASSTASFWINGNNSHTLSVTP